VVLLIHSLDTESLLSVRMRGGQGAFSCAGKNNCNFFENISESYGFFFYFVI
jgi:hypothetical protein